MYSTEACQLNKAAVRALDFMINRFLIRPFKTNNMNAIQECAAFFNFKLPSLLLTAGFNRFIVKYQWSDNYFWKLSRHHF